MTPYCFRFAERASLALLALALPARKPVKVAQIANDAATRQARGRR